MQAESFDPSSISITDKARKYVESQLRKVEALGLMICVNESGCNGYMFELSYVRQEPVDVRTFDFEGDVRVFVENRFWDIVRGTNIDYVTEGLNSSLKFNNPNAESTCGCGESFSVRGT